MKKALLLMMVFLSARGDVCRDLCRQSRTHGMRSADCYKRDIKKIPDCLRSDVEVLDLSYNRIRKIARGDLAKYSNLKILYLQENMIMEIEEGALDDQSSLETLDVSYNAFTSIPSVIFRLPSLKKLYLSQNQNINIVDEVEKAKPIVSPLAYLDLGFNELAVLPDLGVLPTLLEYNISGNNGVKLSTKHFAGLCNLKMLTNTNVTAEFDDPCQCWNLETWLRKREVNFTPFECHRASCDYKIPEGDEASYTKCKEMHEQIILKSLILKIVVPACVILVILVAVGVYFFIRRRRQNHPKINNILYHNASEELIKHKHGGGGGN